MKTLTAALFTLLISLIVPNYSSCEELGAIRMSLVEGNVQIYDRDSDEWLQASINMPLTDGDLISVQGDGRAELHINGGIFVRLDHSTSFELVTLTDTDAHFYLDHGQIYINNKKGGRQIIQIDTPVATNTTADNSISLLSVVDSDTTELTLIKGHAFLESRQGKTRVSSGNSFKISQFGAEVSPISAPDDWENWNLQRDDDQQRLGESTRYLPEELHDYSNDFDKNGKWTFVKEYGYVWSPVVVGFDWVPFRMGQWIWVRNDYVWVSDERWGWAPHHFGRWTNIKGRGWCWVPPKTGSVSWGPGYVAWVQTPSSIGWVPLAPGETYYGRKSYGHGSVVVNTTLKNRPQQSYRNVNINNSVTVISSDSFHRRERQKTVLRTDNPFKQNSYAPQVIPPPALRKPRIDPTTPVNAGNKPTMHHQQEVRTATIRQGVSILDSKANNTHIKPTPQQVIVPPVARQQPSVAEKPAVSTPPQPAVRQQPSSQARNDQKTIKTPVAPDNPRNVSERRGPRTFVRDSNQSAFKSERPKPLPLKHIEEPRKENRKPVELPKKDMSGNKIIKPDTSSQQRGNPKIRNDKP